MAGERFSVASLELQLQARAEFVPVLRERVRVWLEDAGASKRDTFEVLLATTEAFANAVEHPHEPTSHLVDIEGSIADYTITVAIRDYGTWQRERTSREQGGVGLVIMEMLMDVVRVECLMDGTTVTMHRRLAMD
jgi:anti-sigma regulatory factor (Ser/Thr protein kinase)